MMLFPRKPALSPIGVELSARSLRAVQLESRVGGWRVRDAVSLNRPVGDAALGIEEASRLAGVLRRRAFVGDRLVVSLPNRDVVRGLIEVAASAADPILA
ncbi:MAG: hypothetical protein AAFX76_11095, partial [Planctomycetota bacterium]